jgi:hypothetical protein
MKYAAYILAVFSILMIFENYLLKKENKFLRDELYKRTDKDSSTE